MGKNKKKTHNKFRRDQTNVRWYTIGGTNFTLRSRGGGGGGLFIIFFFRISKSAYGGRSEEDA